MGWIRKQRPGGLPNEFILEQSDKLTELPCIRRGKLTDETVDCNSCKGKVSLKLYECDAHGTCTLAKRVPGHGCCDLNCKERVTVDENLQLTTPPTIAYHTPPTKAIVKTSGEVKPYFGMKSPRDKRNTYCGGILQINITRACDRSCFGCTQGSNLAGKPNSMTPDQFKIAVDSLKDYFGIVGIFGGNPTVSPYFDEICQILRGAIPWERRGLWSNNPLGKGSISRITFNPAVSNLNVHESPEAYDEFARDWPESVPFLKGLDCDSRHRPPFVALKDVISDEAERWKLIRNCEINREWSAMIAVFRGELRGWFCELAGAQSILHQDEPDYPDTGHPIIPGWWNKPIDAFDQQIRKHCHDCGIPIPSEGILANGGEAELVSLSHERIYQPKRVGRPIHTVADLIELGAEQRKSTTYLENGKP